MGGPLWVIFLSFVASFFRGKFVDIFGGAFGRVGGRCGVCQICRVCKLWGGSCHARLPLRGAANCAELRSFRRGCMALQAREDNV